MSADPEVIANVETEFAQQTCKHNSNQWNSQSWTKIDESQEKCDFCGLVRWTAGIRNAIREEIQGHLFGHYAKDHFDPELQNLVGEIRKLGAKVSTSTINDPVEGYLYEAKAYIFYRGKLGPMYAVRTSIDEFMAANMLRKIVNIWYGVE